jgi:two-component system, OmpR family, sensor kinase
MTHAYPMTHSLRGRLFVGLTLVIIVMGGGAGFFTFRWAFDEAIEMQDSILMQIASIAVNTAIRNDVPLQGVDAEASVLIEELGSRPSGSSEDRDLWALKDGLHLAMRGSQPWRVLLRTRADGSRFAVGQPTSIRDEIARDTALRTLLPLAALIPCLMLVTALVIARSVRPVIRLAEKLDLRRADELNRLSLHGTPGELHPFIASINRLLDRIQAMMEQQRRFVAEAAHELRTPITALSIQAENLAQVEISEEGRGRLAALQEGTRRAKHLLDQLLALARYDMGQALEEPITPFDQCARDVLADLLPEASHRGIDVGFEVLEELSVRGEPVMLSALIRNLLDNALRFTPRGGHVDLGVYGEGEQAIFQIEDTGPGIAPADLHRIFEPFFRGSQPAEEGTGLGLSIVKRIVTRLHGSVAIENILQNGHTGLRVTARLPAPSACSKSI